MLLQTPELVEPKTAKLPSVIEFNVTDEDILLGAKGNTWQCPIARSVNRTLLLDGYEFDRVSVVFSTITVYRGHAGHYYDHSYANFVGSFDSGIEVAPFTGQALAECKASG